MSIIEFFGHVIKPKKLKGTGVLNPEPTGIVNENISCIRQYDVNIWFYKKGDTLIAIDSGYIDFPDIQEEFDKININPEDVKAVFLTHADMDHAGGVADDGVNIFPNAKLYLQDYEEDMLNGVEKRFRFGPIQIKNPIKR